MTVKRGKVLIPVPVEFDGTVYFSHDRARQMAQIWARNSGGQLAEGPPERVLIERGECVGYIFPAVREVPDSGGTENAGTEGPAQQQGGTCTESRCSAGTQG